MNISIVVEGFVARCRNLCGTMQSDCRHTITVAFIVDFLQYHGMALWLGQNNCNSLLSIIFTNDNV